MGDDLKDSLDEIDTDGSGRIDHTEFIAATITSKQYFKREVLWGAFRTFDKDGDGFITKAELKIMLQDEDTRITDRQIEQMVQEFDLDGDGNISWDEFSMMMIDEKNVSQ